MTDEPNRGEQKNPEPNSRSPEHAAPEHAAPNGGAQHNTAPRNPAIARARQTVAALVAAGVEHVCVCPGGRSAPLVFAIEERPELSTTVHLDERVAGFFALGRARATGRPVAVLVTSGSAGANLAPAVVEATAGGVPLVVITANRPPEKIGWGERQSMDQTRLYGRHAVAFADLGVPEPGRPDVELHRMVVRAVDAAIEQGGVAHLDAPYREPLHPLAGDTWPDPPPVPALRRPIRAAASPVHAEVDAVLDGCSRVAVVVGTAAVSDADRAALHAFAEATGAPVLVDPVSGLRGGALAGRVAHADLFVDSVGLTPDAIVRVGPLPTSKRITHWMRDSGARIVVLDPQRQWREPLHVDATFVGASVPNALSGASRVRCDAAWTASWSTAEGLAIDALHMLAARGELPAEGAVARAVHRAMAPGDVLHVASSMPIRDLDAFGGVRDDVVRVSANRGTNGIDGTLSTGFGLAHGLDGSGRAWILVGDLAAQHDLGALACAALGLRATIVVVNNDGGGIFRRLPMARFEGVFDRYFTTPQTVDLAAVAQGFGVPWQRHVGVEGLGEVLAATRGHEGVCAVEVRVDAAENVEAWTRALQTVREGAASAVATQRHGS